MYNLFFNYIAVCTPANGCHHAYSSQLEVRFEHSRRPTLPTSGRRRTPSRGALGLQPGTCTLGLAA